MFSDGAEKGRYLQLASVDESQSYEVDRAEIYYDLRAEKYVLATAGGCSCWDGEYNLDSFATFEALVLALFKEERQYTPSIVGAIDLVVEAKGNLSKIREASENFKRSSRMITLVDIHGKSRNIYEWEVGPKEFEKLEEMLREGDE